MSTMRRQRPAAKGFLAIGLLAGTAILTWVGSAAAAHADPPAATMSPAAAYADPAAATMSAATANVASASAASPAPGSLLWLNRYHGLNGFNQAYAIAISPDGGTVFVAGTRTATVGAGDQAVVAINATTGVQVWASSYDAFGNDRPAQVAVSPGGDTVFVTGESEGATSHFDYLTIAYNAATGAHLWASRYNGAANSLNTAKSLAVSPDSTTVYVTGYSGLRIGSSLDADYVTIAYSAATGARRWLSRYNGRANQNDQGRSVAVSPDGQTVYVTGRSYGRGSFYDVATVAYNAASGAQRWVSRYNGRANGNDFGTAVTVSPGGRSVYVTGGSTGRTSRSDFATIAYNAATGAARWVGRYNGPGNFDDAGVSLGVTPGGRTLVVTGYSWGVGTNRDYATIAYNAATGTALWTKRYLGTPGYSGDTPAALALSPDGSTVYVTGASDSTTSTDYGTVAYAAATGAQLWVSRFDGALHRLDDAFALVAAPGGGAVYVTGFSETSLSSSDFVTIAYQG